MAKLWIRLFAALLLLFAAATFGLAQRSSGSIVGSVTDQSGAAVPNAMVTVTEVAIGAVRTTVTDSLGNYALPALPPAVYRLSASVTGF